MARGKRFADLAASIAALSSVPSQVASGAAEAIAEQIDEDFDAGLDPYGEPWADLEQATIDKGRRPPPLTNTHEMRDSIEVVPMPGAGISVTIDDPAIHHQYGTVHMVDRPIYPNRKELPDTWRRAIADASDAAYERALRGA